ncbi:TonB-dependent receptor plug domain-containing protein, partial [Bacteroides thetaiotaomicron]|uniref:TonB-dependent receptor plug domain-containing protein n=1 Tax=Bacteroides thetaiotaomicron TaxID=818 RepID=UPI0012D810ED
MITIKNTQHYLLLCIILLCSVLQAFPQTSSKEITVTGVVLDNITNEPLIGVNVSVKNVPGLGSITDINGRYVIKVEPYSRLIFSYVGFETLEILVKNQSKVDVKMKEAEASVLDEVVITGTGVQKKISVTGAISAVNVDELKKTSSSSIVNSLAGNVAGVLAMQTSGQPGLNTSEFWIRGISTFGASNSALVLVDGFERDMNDLSVEDIESFQVLKDAAETAIYGSRGANGVVLITTKHGKASKISISAKVETSYNTRTVTPDYVDGSTYARMLNEARITRNQTPMYSEDELFILDHNLDPDLLPNV